MNRTNIVLSIVLVVVAGVWFLTRDTESGKSTAPAPRMFPSFNKEAVDAIVIEGGWRDTTWVLGRLGSDWKLASAGGYPIKKQTVDTFIDAVYHMRKQISSGSSKDLHKSTRTDEKGRIVRLLKGDTPMAEFRIGKSPKDSSQEFYIRPEGQDEVFRTRTLLTSELDIEPTDAPSPFNMGASGFRWADYTRELRDWVETEIWRLGDAETQKVELARRDKYDVVIVRKGDEEWVLNERGKDEKVPADVDAAAAVFDDLRYLDLVDVLGTTEEVGEEYGLTKPEISLVLTLKQKVSASASDEATADKPGDEKDEKDGKKDEKPKEKFKTVHRILMVGKKVERPDSYDEETGEVKKSSYYAVQIGGDFDKPEMEERAKFVFLVDATTLRGLRKELDELKQKPKDEPKDDDATEDESKEDGASKKDGAAEPKKDEPKKDDAKPDEPKKDEPKDDPKEAEPEKDEGCGDGCGCDDG